MNRIAFSTLAGVAALAAAPVSAATVIDFETTPDGSTVNAGDSIGDTYAEYGVSFSGAVFANCGGGCPEPANGFFAASPDFADPILLTFANPISMFSFENVNASSGQATAFAVGGAVLGTIDFFGFPGQFSLGFDNIAAVQFTTLFQFGVDNVTFQAGMGGGNNGGGNNGGGNNGGGNNGGGNNGGGNNGGGIGNGGAGAIPEPATWAMMLLGFLGTGWAMRARPARRISVRYS